MLHLTDTLSRELTEIRPLTAGRVTMYSCGPTVYRYAHIGNLRTYTLADTIRRVLAYHGLDITSVMNITDVGHMTDELTDSGRDRMELAVADEGREPHEIADFYTQAFLRDCDLMNIRRFDAYPKASDHVEQMIGLTVRLIERGHAYEVDGSVYYDVSTFTGYGELSGQSLDAMRAGHRVEVDQAKRNHQDFVLWKSAGPNRLITFDSPWGKGYPGWHIECSAMALHLLGDRFDIHTGGVDNVFPHHEDERAQSEGVTGHRVVGTWVHGDHLLMGESKMAKSAGNVIVLSDVIAAGHDPLALRALFHTARYRRQVGFTEDSLQAASTALRRLRERIAALTDRTPPPAPTDTVLRQTLTEDRAISHHDRFMEAVDDDLDLPNAMTVLHAMLGDEGLAPATRQLMASSWDEVLGLGLLGDHALERELEALVTERDAARANGDYATADAIRDRLSESGVELIDTPEGTRWVRGRNG
jgi:cysteinyl-tRNA synthetase